MLTLAYGREWAEEIEGAEGEFTITEGQLQARFGDVVYSARGNGEVVASCVDANDMVSSVFARDGRKVGEFCEPVVGPEFN